MLKYNPRDPAVVLAVVLLAILLLLFCMFVATMAVDAVTACTKKLLGAEAKNEALTFIGISMGGVLVAFAGIDVLPACQSNGGHFLGTRKGQ